MASSNPSTGLPRNDSPSLTQNQYNMNGKIIIPALILLFLLVLFIIAMHIYAKWFWRLSADRRRQAAAWRRSNGLQLSQGTSRTGLDKDIVESLPIFTYKAQLLEEAVAATAVECAVCLSEFQEDEKCRLLPKCSHSFHTDCIDMWFLSNTTCPLCRTSADPSVSEEEHDGASPIACLLPHQDRVDHMEGLGSGFANGGQHQDSSGFTIREALGSAFGIRSGLGYGNGDESGLNDGRERNNHSTVDQMHTRDGEALFRRQLSLQSPGARSWRRSISDRFPNITHGIQFPTNVLFWGNYSHVNSRVNSEHWQIGGRSLPHIILDIPRPQEGSFLAPRSTSTSPSRHSPLEHQSGPSPSMQRPINRLNSLKRLLSREKKVFMSEPGMSSCDGGHSSSAKHIEMG